mgnify:CR=1 FL=1
MNKRIRERKPKRPNILKNNCYVPTVLQCEKCEYQDQCEGGEYCVHKPSKRRRKRILTKC